MYQHVSDWHNNTGVIRQAEEQGMGIILMRVSARCGSWTSGVLQRLMAGGGSRRFDIGAVASDGGSGTAWVGLDPFVLIGSHRHPCPCLTMYPRLG